jgi:hypothetical protein
MNIVPSYIYEIWPLNELKHLPPYGDYIILAALFFQMVYLAGDHISKRFSSYNSLTTSKKASWCIHIVSQVFTSIILVLIIPIFSEPALQNDKIFGTAHYPSLVYTIACG